VEKTTLDCSPQKNFHENMPKNDAIRILGFTIFYHDFKEELIIYDQEFDRRQALNLPSDE
jgi:hypothetical protein